MVLSAPIVPYMKITLLAERHRNYLLKEDNRDHLGPGQRQGHGAVRMLILDLAGKHTYRNFYLLIKVVSELLILHMGFPSDAHQSLMSAVLLKKTLSF